MFKKLRCTYKVAIVVLVVFILSLVLLDFIFSLRKLQILKGASPLALAKSMYYIQLFRERLSEKMCTRQSRKVIWDMINTLFLTL